VTHGIIRCLDFFAKHVICLIQCEVDNALTAYWNTRGVIARSRQCDAAVFLCRRGVWPAGDPVTRTDRRDVVGAASALMHRASSRTERMSSQRHWPRLVVYPASRVSREFLQMHYYFQCPPPWSKLPSDICLPKFWRRIQLFLHLSMRLLFHSEWILCHIYCVFAEIRSIPGIKLGLVWVMIF